VRLLLDTCTFLWVTITPDRLSETARRLFQDPGNTVYLSVTSAWEIAVKAALGKLSLPEAPQKFVPRAREDHGVESLALTEESALHLVSLPAIHRDPFDRMLVAQALQHGMVILTPDEEIQQYPVRTQW
jgi:PIN domain nuclease of toxin-antitoxin system